MSARTVRRPLRFREALDPRNWLPRHILLLIGVMFWLHLLLFAVNANWWNDPAFLPTSPAGGR